MKNKLFPALKILFFLGLGFLLIWLVVRGLSQEQKDKIIEAFKVANYWWLLPSVILAFAAHFSRAIRWKMMLKPMGYTPSTVNSFLAIMIGYLANLAVPRLGEVTRCGILNRYDKVPIYKSVGTVVTERAIDLITLFLLFFFVFATQFDRLGGYAANSIINPIKTKLLSTVSQGALMIVGVVGLALIIVVLFLLRGKIKKNVFIQRIIQVIRGFAEGLRAVRRVEKPWIFLAHSIFIWMGYYFMLFFCFFCLKETSSLGIDAALSVLAFASLAMIATPGGIGAYPATIMAILGLYAIEPDIGFAFGWIAWTGQTLLVIIVGFVSLLILPVINPNPDGTK